MCGRKILRPYKRVHPFLVAVPPITCPHLQLSINMILSCKLSARFFFGEADFFSAKRLFFRAARDVSGAHCVPPWARVEIKLKMIFQALSHSSSHERASALTSPPPDFLFISIHQNPTIPPQAHHPDIHPTQPHQKQAAAIKNSRK